MRTTFVLVCLVAFLQGASARDLTVLLDYDQPVSEAAHRAMASELKSILAAAQVNLDLRLRAETAEHEQFSQVLVFRMSGQCSMRPLPVAALSDERGPLAMTFATEGEPLPFGEVKCDRVRTSILRTTPWPTQVWGSTETRDRQYGIALARVMAHEIYHMIGHTAEHTRSGITKRALSSLDLSSGTLSYSEAASSRVSGSH